MLCTGVGIAGTFVGEQRDDIRRMLLGHQRELLNEIQNKVRDARETGSNYNHHRATDLRETVEVDPEDDLAFALIQMKSEALERVNEAVRRVADGTYGYCVDCDDVIASARLHAMPFAVRCRDCEETREDEEKRERVPLQRVQAGAVSRY